MNRNNESDNNSFDNISETSKNLLSQLESENNINKPSKDDESRESSSKQSNLLLIIAILSSGGLAFLGIVAASNSFFNRDQEDFNSQQSAPNTSTSPKATTQLRGSVGYPGSGIPKLAICSINSVNRAETCEEFPASNHNYEYSLDLDAPGEYWVYWTPQEWYLKGKKFWIGACPPNRSGACSEFRVTRFKAHPKIRTIPNIDVGELNPTAPLVFD